MDAGRRLDWWSPNIRLMDGWRAQGRRCFRHHWSFQVDVVGKCGIRVWTVDLISRASSRATRRVIVCVLRLAADISASRTALTANASSVAKDRHLLLMRSFANREIRWAIACRARAARWR